MRIDRAGAAWTLTQDSKAQLAEVTDRKTLETLTSIFERSGPVPTIGLAEGLGVSRQRAAELVGRVVQRGWAGKNEDNGKHLFSPVAGASHT